jgi:Protein of unknown function (DUF4254)
VTAQDLFPPAADIVAVMEGAMAGSPKSTGDGAWTALIADLVASNLRQWDLEDTTRDPTASDAEVTRAKREIDRLNSGRHRLVQQIDADIDSMLDQPATAPLATESPGMVLDRLSVLVIRRFRTSVALRRDTTLADRVLSLDSQVGALCDALDFYLDELGAGARRFLPYESLKLYRPSPKE